MILPKKDISEINEDRIVDQIRSLGLDMIQQAQGGHPGIILGAAPILYTLYAHHMMIDPECDNFFNRDRFIMSSGHGSALLYSILYMAGFDVSLDDLKQYRMIDSKTPGYPEFGVTPGVDVSTGLHGQGFATAVGIAMAEANLEARYNNSKQEVINFNTYVLCSDGDLMEGVSYEAASLAGTLKLNKLIVLYDANKNTVDGNLDQVFTDNISERFSSMGWNVVKVDDGNDIKAIDKAISDAKSQMEKPTLIEVSSSISKFLKDNSVDVRFGESINEDEITKIKNELGVRDISFSVSQDVLDDFRLLIDDRCSKIVEKFDKILEKSEENIKNEIINFSENKHGFDFKDLVFDTPSDGVESPLETSSKILKSISNNSVYVLGGSSDLFKETKTFNEDGGIFSANNYLGKNICFGAREEAMGAILNGLSLCGFVPYASTYLAFSDYLRTSLRMACQMKLKSVYILSHDSISIGEEGSVHQPIEQLSTLRVMPELEVFRPADVNEVLGVYKTIMSSINGPVVISLSNTNLAVLETTNVLEVNRGGYIVYDPQRKPMGILIATGEEVHLAIEVAKRLMTKGIDIRVVSMPSIKRFKAQDSEYIESILPVEVRKIVIEAGSSMSWNNLVFNEKYLITLDQFGVSGKKEDVYDKFGFSIEKLEEKVEELLK